MSKKLILTVIFVSLLFLGGGIYFARSRRPGVDLKVGPYFSPSPQAFSGWETYSSPFGYTISYPPKVRPREQGRVSERILDVTSFVTISEGKTTPILQVKVSSLSFEEEVNRAGINVGGFLTQGPRGEKIVVDQTEGVKSVGKAADGKTMISVFLPARDKTFILLGSPEAISGKDYTETIAQMISSFNLP